MTFFDIFSKKEIIEKKLPIHVDHREKNSLVVAELVNLGHQIKFEQLAVGDYIINDTAIERKTVSDLKSSIINKRIMSQLSEIKQFPKSILLVEGFNERSYSGLIHENALRGFLLAVALDYQIPIIYAQDEKDSAKFLSVLAKKEGKSEPIMRGEKRVMTKKEQIQFILEGLPGIGPKSAKKLIDNFKSITKIVNASKDELSLIIGKKAQDVREILDSE